MSTEHSAQPMPRSTPHPRSQRKGAAPGAVESSTPSRVGVPKPVRAAFVLWIAAVAAGTFEVILAVIDLVPEGFGAGIVVGVVVRLVVFATAIYLATRLRLGRNWARVSLTILLGIVGTLSLVIGPIQWLIEGNSLGEAVADADALTVLFATSRTLHLAAVVTAMVLMYRPAANAYFRASPR